MCKPLSLQHQPCYGFRAKWYGVLNAELATVYRYDHNVLFYLKWTLHLKQSLPIKCAPFLKRCIKVHNKISGEKRIGGKQIAIILLPPKSQRMLSSRHHMKRHCSIVQNCLPTRFWLIKVLLDGEWCHPSQGAVGRSQEKGKHVI